MGFKLTINFNDGTSQEVDEIFDTEQDAIAEYESWLDSWGAGRETLMLAGEDYSDADIEDYDIEEV